ncbi:MAG: helix-turn-helix transcriptional regulator [Clostridia bacterium]|nr:helix-turn-helix transcriptional regulator [Clostridia bacterium]
MEGSIGEKIATLRKANGMTQADLGTCLNISYQAVSKWERGESCPDFETLSKIAQLYGVSISYFERKTIATEENQPAVEQTAAAVAEPMQDQKLMLGVCKKCGKMIFQGEQGESDDGSLVCAACWEKVLQQRRASARAAKAAEEATRAELERISATTNTKTKTRSFGGFGSRGKGLIIGGVIGVLVAAVFIWAGVSGARTSKEVWSSIWVSLALGAFAFFYSSQLFWDGIVLDITLGGAKLIGEPGVIFSFDLDGLFFLIGIKILFGLLRILVFLLTALGGVLLAILISPFSFVPALISAD